MAPTAAVCQCAIEDLDVAANRTLITECVSDLDPTVDMAVFPEYTLTGFVADERLHEVALARDDSVIGELQSLAATAELALVFGFVEHPGDEFYNATAYIDSAGDLTVYRKRHLWNQESELLAPGTERVTVETPIGTAGMLTCYDLNFVAESVTHARPGVTALLVAGAWPAAHVENWKLLTRARAVDGLRWVLAANRTGEQSHARAEATTFAGHSRIVEPRGTVQCEADGGETTLTATLDSGRLAAQREEVGIFADNGAVPSHHNDGNSSDS